MTAFQEHVYLAVSTDIFYKIIGSKQQHENNAIVTEISESSIKFINMEIIPKNSLLDIRIKVNNSAEPVLATARVLWQRKIVTVFSEGELLSSSAKAGGALHETCLKITQINPLEDKKLKKYIHQFSEKTAVNRGHVRLPLIIDAKCKIGQSSKDQEFDCVIGDIGLEGVKLFVKDPAEVNSNITVVFELPEGFGTFKLLGTVVRKSPAKHGVWGLGIEFKQIRLEDKEKILEFISSKLTDIQ